MTGNFSGISWTTNATTPGAPTGTAASGDGLLFGPSAATTLTNDDPGFTIAGLTFNAGASAFNIGGNAFTLTGAITNNGANAQTVNAAISANGQGATVTLASAYTGTSIAAATTVGHVGGGAIGLNGAMLSATSSTRSRRRRAARRRRR